MKIISKLQFLQFHKVSSQEKKNYPQLSSEDPHLYSGPLKKLVPLKVNLSLPPAGGLVPSSSCFLEKESMLLKPFPESISLMDIVVDCNITLIIVVRVEVKQDGFKFNLELN